MPTYAGTTVKDLDVTTPTEGATPPSEVNDAIREVKTIVKNDGATVTVTGDTNLTAAHHVILCNGTLTLTLPQASTVASATFTKEYIIVNIGTGTVTIDGYSSETINGAATQTLSTQYNSMCISTNGSNWFGGKSYGSNDYLESTWTPAANGVTITVTAARYTKIGRMVFFSAHVVWPSNANSNQARLSGLPFTIGANGGASIGYNDSATEAIASLQNGAAIIYFYAPTAATTVTNSNFSNATIHISGSYSV